jgi:hypothetical protein
VDVLREQGVDFPVVGFGHHRLSHKLLLYVYESTATSHVERMQEFEDTPVVWGSGGGLVDACWV